MVVRLATGESTHRVVDMSIFRDQLFGEIKTSLWNIYRIFTSSCCQLDIGMMKLLGSSSEVV